MPIIATATSRLQDLSQALRRSSALLPAAEAGGVATIVGLSIIPMVLALGLAVDAGLAYGAHSKLQGALDSAALASARTASMEGADVEADARMYFNANFPSDYLGSRLIDFDAVFNEETGELSIDAEINMPTSFMRVAGFSSIPVAASTVAQRQLNGIELAMVLDITGSMNKPDPSGGTKIEALKNASETLLNVIYGENETVENVSISVVPYTTQVNIGSDRTNFLTEFNEADFGDDGWKGCVEARADTLDRDDTPPSIAPFSALFSPSGDPNAACQDNEVLPLTAERSIISDHIDDLEADGSTFTNVGFAWGWRTISPEWRTAWDITSVDSENDGDLSGFDTSDNGTAAPVDYDDPTISKAIIFMTDGRAFMPRRDYTAYGFLSDRRLGTNNKSRSQDEINDRLLDSCALAKQEGIDVYTIMFALDDANIEQTYRTCASSEEHFFDAPNGEALEAAFENIAGQLTSLRLTQ